MSRALVGRVFDGERILDEHAVRIDGDRIASVEPAAHAPPGTLDNALRLPADALLVPGFIDVQINGAGGALFNDAPTADTAIAIAAAVRRFGTTGVLPTLLTDERAKMRRACDAALDATARPASGVLGVHLEGPFLSRDRPGVHAPRWMRTPDADDVALLTAFAPRLGDRGRLLVTLAPECVDDTVIAQLAAGGIVLAAGHTAATFERTHAALRAGVRGFTHLFNAMPPVFNRQPGPVIAAFTDTDAWCSVIVDGFHVHAALLQLLLRAKPGRVLVITDAMPPCGTDATSFTLDGHTVRRAGGRLVTDDGILAGADLDMATSVRNCVELLGLSLEESLRMASLYPASYLGLDHQLGRAAPGYRADLALLRADFSVAATWIGGEIAWHDARSN